MKRELLTLKGDSSDIFKALRAIREADEAAEKTQNMGCWMIGLSICGFFGSAMVFDTSPTFGKAGLILCGLVLLAGIVQHVRGSAGNIEDERYEFVSKLHRFLTSDCDQSTQYEYQLELRPYTDSSFYVRREGFFSFFGGTAKFYHTPLISTRLRLRDGTALSLQIDRATVERTRTRMNARGKIKTKTKKKYRDIYQIKVKRPTTAPPLPLELKPPSLASSDPTLGSVTSYVGEPKYKVDGNRASLEYVKKTLAPGPDPGILLQLLCRAFYSIHCQQPKSA